MLIKTPFLKQVAQQIIEKHPNNFQDVLLIFPTERNGLFFKKYFEEALSQGAYWLPQITTLDTLLSKLSSLNKQDVLAQVVILHQHYQELMNGNGLSLDKFFSWAHILLDDFNQIDTYLADAAQVFRLIKDEKEIDELFDDFLEEEEKEFLREFWSALARKLPKKADSDEEQEQIETEKANFLKFWSIIPELYARFNASIEAQKAGTIGLIRKRGYESLASKKVPMVAKDIYLVGFQILEPAPFKAFEILIKEYKAQVIWNIGAWYNKKSTGQIIDPYLKKFHQSELIAPTLPAHLNNKEIVNSYPSTGIRLYSGNFPIDEAKIAGQILEQLQNEVSFDEQSVANVALVLTDSSLLGPILSSIPDAYKALNVTTTFGFKETALNIYLQLLGDVLLFNLKEKESELAQALENKEGSEYNAKPLVIPKEFAYRIVANSIFPWISRNGNTLLQQWQESSSIVIAKDAWGNEPNLRAFADILYFEVQTVEQVWEWFIKQLNLLADSIGLSNENNPLYVDRQYIYSAITTIVKIRDTVSRLPKEILTKAQVVNLIKESLQYSSLAFTGDPIEGLQIMGLFETQNLNFDKILLIGANEGNLPPKFSSLNSFIPYSIRKAFKLQLPELQDSRYKNLFFSLVDNANDLFLIYAMGQTEVGQLEPSRYINQIRYLYKSLNVISPGTDALSKPPALFDYSPLDDIKIEIQKTPAILTKLKKYYKKEGGAAFSNSSLGTYITCSLKFYFNRILKLQVQKEFTLDLEAEVMGTVVHACLEKLYKPFEGKTISNASAFNDLEKQVEKEVDSLIKFHKNLGNQPIKDKLILSKEMAIAFVKRVLAFDKYWLENKTKQLEIIQLEQALNIELPITLENSDGTEEVKIRITGNLDRLDRTDLGIRILDYKTGSDKLDFAVSFDAIFQGADYKQIKAMQVMLYALLYFESHPNELGAIEVGLLPVKELFGKTKFDNAYHYNSIEGDNTKLISRELVDNFKTRLVEKIKELYNPAEPFKQTTNISSCRYCEFINICGRRHLV